MVGHPGALLEARVVLFVDDDEAEVGDGAKSAAGTDHDADLAGADATPLVEALAGCQARVEHRDRRADRRAEDGDELRRERDLSSSTSARLLRSTAARTSRT